MFDKSCGRTGCRAVLTFVSALALFSAAAGAADSVTSEKEKAQVIDGLAVQLRELYVESGADRKAIETGIRTLAKGGAYRKLSGEAFARALEADLRRVGRDEHFRVVFYADQVPPQPTSFTPTPEIRARQRPMFATGYNNGFTTTSRLDGNIGYIDINSIPDAEYVRDTAAAVMTFVMHTDALILDLRRARGGQPDGIAYLLSYFLADRVHAFDMVSLKEKEQHFTESALPGPRYGASKPVFVLTSKDTFSGGEMFAYSLQAFKRVQVVGEKTRGGSTAAMPVKVSDHFVVGIPAMATISAVTGTNWNNVGVIPDVEAPAAAAQDAAYRLALQRILENERDPVRQDRIRSRLQSLGPALP
jgi:retinol-binding protein 3